MRLLLLLLIPLLWSGGAFAQQAPEPSPEDPDPATTILAPVLAAPAALNAPAINTANAVWTAVGPRPNFSGQSENVSPNDAVAGAVHVVLPHPTNPDIMYIGGVNAGVWKTVNASASSPTWTPLTDHLSSMSIGAMGYDPADPDRILVGIGRYSSYGRAGGALTGLQLTTDAGSSWTEINHATLQGRNISGVALRGNTMLASASSGGGGLYRSTDGGSTWSLVSGSGGLPTGNIFDLVGDPGNTTRFFVAVQGDGIYMSDDTGATWTNISVNDATANGVKSVLQTNGGSNNNTEMAVAPNGRLYVGLMTNGQAAAIGYADNNGTSWGTMDLPRTQEGDGDVEGLNPREKPGSQGGIHFSIAADPTDSTIVYVGGDRQDTPFPNFIGARDFSGRLFRGRTTIAPTGGIPSPQWDHLTHNNNIAAIPNGGTASGSAPHADSRDMAFDAAGNLIESDDGGVYRRTQPRSNQGDWFSIVGDLQVAEYHDIVFDPVSSVVVGGSQDAGNQRQLVSGQPAFDTVSGGDGAEVDIDYESSTGQSILYSSAQNLGGFARRVFDSGNNLVGASGVALNGSSIIPQFNTPVVLNRVDPTSLVIGGALHVHESFDQGDNVRQITLGTGVEYFNGKPLVYGGFLSGVGNPDIIWAGSFLGVYVRTNNGTTMSSTTFPGGTVRSIDIASDDWRTAYACDSDQVWVTTDVGVSWTEITGTLTTLGAQDFHKLLVITTTSGDAIVLGCRQGVFIALASDPTQWSAMNGGLPNAPVWDLDYYAQDDVLVAGTLGRGAWRLSALAGGSDIAVSGNGVNILNGTAVASANTGSDFGATDINGGTVTRTFDIMNTGSDTLTITLPISLTGTEAADYSITANPATSLPAGGSTSFAVTFNPSAAGTRAATVSIANNDPNENPFTFAVSGVGGEFPDIAVTGKGVVIGNNDFSPSTLDGSDFGAVDILGGKATNVFVIVNTGPTNLSVTLPIGLSGTAAADFVVVTNPPTNIGALASATFAVSFTPGAIGQRSATLAITNSDPDESPYSFAIQGLGATVPDLDLFGNGNAIVDGDTNPSATDNTLFGGADITGGAVTQTFFITNNGSATLNLFLPIQMSGLHGADFSVTTPPATSVATGAFTSFSVTFNPSGVGQRDATMQINSSDPDESPYDVALRGTGLLVPELGVFGNGLEIVDGDTSPTLTDGTDFGNAVLTVDTVTRTFVLTNQGSSNVTINLPINVTGSAAGDFGVTPPALKTLTPGASTTFQIAFTPSAAGTRNATVSITNNDPDENPYTFDVTGQATEAEVAVLGNGQVIADGSTVTGPGNNTDFGSADVTTGSVTRSFTITNSGNASLTVFLPINFSGPAAADFTLSTIPSSSIPPGGATVFSVTFNPNGTGVRNATLSFGNTDANENPYDFAVSGIGTGPDIAVLGNGSEIPNGSLVTAFTNFTDFGTNTVSLGARTNTFVLTNTGSGKLTLTLPIAITNDPLGDFSVSRQPATNALLAGEFTTFEMAFAPVGGGVRTSLVRIGSGDSDENPYEFLISGLGDGPEISVLGNNLVITNLDNSPDILDGTIFGGADLNSGSVDRTFVITNEGTQPLTLALPVSFSGSAASDFAVVSNPAVTTLPGRTNAFVVRFDPTSIGTRLATLSVASNDGNEPDYRFDISGVGIVIPPTITSSPVGRTLNAVQDATLFVGANGTTPLTYYWYRDNVLVPGVNSAALPLNDVTLADAGLYHVVVSNLAGTVTSDTAQITVNLLPSVASWSNPAPITYGTPLGAGQLNAVASVAGTFVYSPVAGAVLGAGMHTLDVTFTPANPLVYSGSMASVQIVVNPAPLTLRADDQQRLVNTANPTLTFTASGFVNGDGVPSLTPAPSLSTTAATASPAATYPITFVGAAANPNYTINFVDGSLLVFEAAPAIVQEPVDVTTNALSDVSFQVSATGVAPLNYQWFTNGVPIPGETSAVLSLSGVTVNDALSYRVQVSNGSGSVLSAVANLTVNLLNPVITWPDPADIVYGTALGATELNAGADVGGSFAYAPDVGTILGAGSHTLNATFTPTDTLNYNTVGGAATLVVTPALLVVRADNKTREFGFANPAFTFSPIGLVAGDTLASLAVQPMGATSADANSLPGNYAIVASGASSPNYSISHSNGVLTVFANAPMITVQPGSQTVVQGAPATFVVAAAGTVPLSYQWRFGGVPIAGATAATYTVAAANPGDAGAYDVVVSNVGGSATSAAASLTVLVPPSIVQQPLSQNGGAVASVSLSVVATGSIPLTYQWRKDGVDLLNRTNALLVLSNLSTNDAADYQVVITNEAGTATSTIATVTVTRLTPVVTWPASAPINYGTPLSSTQLNASANVPGTFAYSPDTGSVLPGGAPIVTVVFTPLDTGRYEPVTINRAITVNPVPLTVNAVDASREVGTMNPVFAVNYSGFVAGDGPGDLDVQPIVMTSADQASPVGTYDLVPVGGSSGNYVFNYVNGTLTVVAVPVSIVQEPVSLVATQGMDASFSVTAAGSTPISYQWRKNGSDLPGETAAVLNLVGVGAADDAMYDVVVTNGANAVTSAVVTLDVLLESTISWPASGNVVYGTALGATELDAVAGVPGTLTYTPDLGTILPAGTHALNVAFAPADTSTYLPTNATVNITVDPAMLTITADAKFREFGTANPPLTASFSGFVLGEDSSALTTQPMLATTADPDTLPGNVPITIGGASSPNYTINHVDGTLTVFANLPNITSAPMSQTVTNGDPVTLAVTTAGTAPLTLQWRFNGVPIADETNAVYMIAAAQPSDAGVYDLVVTNVAGTITSQPANLTVLVPPAITVQPQSQTFNAFSDVTFTVTATGTAPLLYQWFRNGQPLAGQTNGTLSLLSVSPTDVGAYVVSVSNDAGTVNSDPATLSVNELAPAITWADPANITYGTPLGAVQLNAETFVQGSFVYNPPTGTVLASGTHTLNVTFNPLDSTNFLSTNASVMITVDKAPLLVSAANQSREYNTPNQPFVAALLGLVNGEDSSALNTQPTITSSADLNSLLGDYPIDVSGATADNYLITHSNATLTVFANPPGISQQPTNTFTTNGFDALLSVAVTGTTPIGFQWRKDGVDLVDETNADLTIAASVAGVHNGDYDVVLANIAGSITSAVAHLTVLVSPQIVVDPMDQTVDALSTVVFGVTATGTSPLAYEWRKGGVPVPDATNATLTLTGVTTNVNGDYSVVVSNGAGSVTSADANLVVNQLTPAITWPTPASIVYGTPLGTNQLNATVATSGTLVYSPVQGVILPVGNHTVDVQFTPDDQVNYLPNSAMVTVTVTPAPLQVRADDKTREFGAANPALTATITGFVNNETIAVLTSPPMLSTAADVDSLLGSYPILVSGAAAANYSVTHVAGNLTVFGIVPVITRHPVNQTVAVGTNVSFDAAASGTAPLSFQWRKAGLSLPGETNSILTISNVSALASGAYDVVVTNIAGSVSSFAAVLNVLSPPNFVLNPTNQAAAIGQPILLRSLAAGSVPINYQWYKDGALLAGETGSDLFIAAANLLSAGDYSVVAGNIAGVQTSAVAQVTVSQSPSLVQQPAPVTVSSGAPLLLSAVAYGEPPLTYHWLRNGVPIQTSASSALFVPSAGLGDVGLYQVIVSNAFGQSQSQEFLVTLSGPPLIVREPVGPTVLPGTNVVFEVIASGSQPLSYLWQKNGQVIPGRTSRTLSLTNITPADAGLYSVAVGNAQGVTVSSFAALTVITTPTILIQPTNQIGAVGSTLTLAVSALSPVAPSHQWRFQGVPIIDATNSTLTLTNLTALNAGDYDVAVSNPSGSVTSDTATVTVLVPPALIQQPVGLTISVGQNAMFAASSVGSEPLSYQWMRDGVDLPGQTGSTLSLPGVARADQASYSVRVGNPVGSAISSSAPLRVLETQILHSLSGGRLNRFRLHFGDQSGVPLTPADAAGFIVETTTDLTNWTVISSNGVGLVLTNGLFRFEDINSVVFPRRYYRVREQ